MRIIFKCKFCGYKHDFSLPVKPRGKIVVPCVGCEEDYLISENEPPIPYKERKSGLLPLHY